MTPGKELPRVRRTSRCDFCSPSVCVRDSLTASDGAVWLVWRRWQTASVQSPQPALVGSRSDHRRVDISAPRRLSSVAWESVRYQPPDGARIIRYTRVLKCRHTATAHESAPSKLDLSESQGRSRSVDGTVPGDGRCLAPRSNCARAPFHAHLSPAMRSHLAYSSIFRPLVIGLDSRGYLSY